MTTYNESFPILASAARTATVTGDDIKNLLSRGIHLIIDVTAIVSTPSVVPKIQAKDPTSGKYYDLITGAAITGTGTTVLKVFPAATASANVAVNDFLPSIFRVVMTHGNANSITYSVAANLLKA
jgi:hypothetical protein